MCIYMCVCVYIYIYATLFFLSRYTKPRSLRNFRNLLTIKYLRSMFVRASPDHRYKLVRI